MKIVVLDGYTLNPGDLCWGELEKLGQCEIHDRTAPDERLSRAHDADIVLTNKVVLDRDTLRELPKLKFVCILSTGVNVVDLEAARERNVPVSNVPEYSTDSVAQLTMALLLELCHHVGDLSRSVRDGRWTESRDFCYWDEPLIALPGREMGIVGFGKIGRRVAELAHAFGMAVCAYEPNLTDAPAYVRRRSFEDLLATSDVVTFHCPLTSQTHGIVNAGSLSLMKDTAFLINTARGGLVREQDLAEALNAGEIGGAGLDVLSTEPPHPGNPLLCAKNCIVTPHVAWATGAARQRLMATAVANVKAFIEGNPVNVVN